MKCNPLRWVWGLVPVALLGWAAVQVKHADIEADLTSRVEEQLKGSGFKWVRTGFSGRDGLITGTATDDSDPDRAYDIARSVWGVRQVDNKAALIEKIESYQWSAVKTGNSVRLGGYVPNEAVRAEILKSAKANLQGQDIIDDMKLARGVPAEGWLSGVNFGLKQVAGLKSGEARLNGLGLTVSGIANDVKSFGSVKAALASDVPKGVKLVDDKVTAPVVKPFVWTAIHKGGQLALGGYVPGDRARAEILAMAKAAFPRSTVEDKMIVADGAATGHAPVAVAALKELSHLEDGTAEIRDATLSVQGFAVDTKTADTVRQGLGKGLPQGFQMTEAIKVRDTGPKLVNPYMTAITADAGGVVLSGYAPSEAAREQLAQAARARFPGRRVDNRLEIASGAPDGWSRCMEGGVAGAGRLGGGKLSLTDRRLDVAGATDDEELAGALPNDIKAAVRGDCDATVRIDVLAENVPDLTWRANFSGSEVVLDGDVPNAAAKASLAASAQRLFPAKTVVDRMRIVESKGRKWPLAAEQGLVALAELQRGEATLSKAQLTVSGQAADAGALAKARDLVGRGLARGYVGRDQIALAVPVPTVAPVVPAPANPVVALCQGSLQDTAREGMIRFERASSTLTQESFTTLNRLASVVKNCPNIVVEIEGHTDSEGAPDRNQALSDRRARSIVDYLSRTGVDAQRLVAIGYGDTRPLVPNDTAENRAKNRRIEFTVKPR